MTSTVFSGCLTGPREFVANRFKVGPEYCKPMAPIADQWIDYADDRVISEGDIPWDWWRVFNDDRLEVLVRTAYSQNISLREAGFRILEARANRAISVGALFPQQQTAFGGYTRQILSQGVGLQGGGGGGLGVFAFPRSSSIWVTGTQLAWEVDFWGQYRRAIEAADADLDASIEDYDNVLRLLVADVALSYIEIRTLEQRIVYALANVKTQQDSLDLANTRLAGGAASKLDVTQATTNLGRTEALVPGFHRQLRQAENRLCVLLGIPPQNIRELLGEPRGIPKAAPEVVVGVPADLLRRRPDVRRAERECAAQSARIGVVEADLYPAFSISGNIFVRADQFPKLFDHRSFGSTFGPSFNWNILNYGRIVNAVAAEQARFMQQVAQYQTVVLNANREAEDSIVGFLRSQEEVVYIRKAADASLESRDLVEALYRGGKADFGRVFVAELVLTQDQDNLAIAEGSVAANLVEVYRSLGGGWQLRFDESDPSLVPLPTESPEPVQPMAPPQPDDLPPAPPVVP